MNYKTLVVSLHIGLSSSALSVETDLSQAGTGLSQAGTGPHHALPPCWLEVAAAGLRRRAKLLPWLHLNLLPDRVARVPLDNSLARPCWPAARSGRAATARGGPIDGPHGDSVG